MKVYGNQHSSEAFFRETSPSCFEPKAEKVIAFHGKDASYAYNVLTDLKAAGASYTRRNIIADMFRRLGVK
ncbi:hypothetical protein ACWJO7_26930 [Klebsiella pneumoniae]